MIPEKAQGKVQEATVVAVGSGVKNEVCVCTNYSCVFIIILLSVELNILPPNIYYLHTQENVYIYIYIYAHFAVFLRILGV